MKFSRPAAISAVLLFVILSISGCKDENLFQDEIFDTRKVMIIYSAGHNDLSSALKKDISELIRNTSLHTDNPRADALVIFTHSRNSQPYLIYPHRNIYGSTVIDTLVKYPENTISVSPSVMNDVLTYIKDKFPADEYGLLFSSHATGFLPEGYYSDPMDYETDRTNLSINKERKPSYSCFTGIRPIPYTEPVPEPGALQTKSIGQHAAGNISYEMRLEDFAEAIPYKMKFIIFDCCFMGGIETAYQLREKTDYLVGSPTEVLADGMDYKTMMSYLWHRPEADLEGFCKNYYEYYNKKSGSERSATISLTDCNNLEPLGRICRRLFDKYRENLSSINYSSIQQYYRFNKHWFYDFGNIVESLGCTEDELKEFQDALDDCIIYKVATKQFIGITINKYSGLSMYLPCHKGTYGNTNLCAYYTGLEWNLATQLVQ